MHDYMSGWAAFVDRLEHLILPVASLTLLTTAGIARYQRAAMLEVLPADYIRTARAKGLTEREVIWRHALRTALTPMVTLLGLVLPGAPRRSAVRRESVLVAGHGIARRRRDRRARL